jgi:hypothetical protein
VTGLSWVEEARTYLDAGRADEANILDADYTAGSGTLTLRFALQNVSPGAWLTVGQNVLRVWAVNALSKQATVVGGQQGSTDVDVPAGTMALVNPRFTDYKIFRAINAHLASLSSPRNGLYQVKSQTFTYQPQIQGYPLDASSILRVLEVRRQVNGPSLAWPRVMTGQYDLLETAPSSDFPTGLAIRVLEGESGRDIQVLYATRFDRLSNPADDTTSSGITDDQADIVPLGAAIRLMSGKEASRNLQAGQGDSRDASEVPPGALSASLRPLQQLWAQRVGEEAAVLTQRYPVTR